MLCLALLHSASAQQQDTSADEGLEDAKRLLDSGRPEQALELLRQLAHRSPADENVAFIRGLAAVAAAEHAAAEEKEREALLDEGIAALHGVLVGNPDAVRVRIELAYAFFLKREDELANEHFERALASSPPRDVAARIAFFLDRINKRKRFTGYISLQVAPDSSNPTDGTVNLFGLRVPVRDNSLDQSNVGLQVAAGGQYQFPLGGKGNLHMLAGADAVRTEHEGGEADETSLKISAGPNFKLTERTETSLLGVLGRDWVAGSTTSREYGLKLSASHHFSARLGLNGSTYWRNRRSYTSSSLNGPQISWGLRAQYLLTPTASVFASLGLTRSRPQALGSRSRGRSIGFGASFLLPAGWTLGGDGNWDRTRYEGSSFSVSGFGARTDHTRTFRLNVLNRGFTLLGFSPQLSIVRELRDSNSSIAGYQRKRAELRLLRQF